MWSHRKSDCLIALCALFVSLVMPETGHDCGLYLTLLSTPDHMGNADKLLSMEILLYGDSKKISFSVKQGNPNLESVIIYEWIYSPFLMQKVSDLRAICE